MCLAQMSYTAPDENGVDMRITAHCPDPSEEVLCVYHSKVLNGLCEPCLPDYAKDPVLSLHGKQIWAGAKRSVQSAARVSQSPDCEQPSAKVKVGV